MSSALDAGHRVLTEAGGSLHYREIAKRALEKGYTTGLEREIEAFTAARQLRRETTAARDAMLPAILARAFRGKLS